MNPFDQNKNRNLTPDQRRRNDLLRYFAEQKAKIKKSLISGRPNRDTVINNIDMINLKIALNASRNFEEFISVV